VGCELRAQKGRVAQGLDWASGAWENWTGEEHVVGQVALELAEGFRVVLFLGV
jgi:hypothetical protein